MARPIRGVTKSQEVARTRILVDTRSAATRMAAALASPLAIMIGALTHLALLVELPALFEMALITSGVLALFPYYAKVDMPFRVRRSLQEIDPKDIPPSETKPQMARGILFMGNRIEDNAEIWAANEDTRTHAFILGSTGAGKTEALLSLNVNALVWGSGFAYMDGKGDVSLWAKAFAAARKFGREDDIFVINYMTGNADASKKRTRRLSNTFNPQALGNADNQLQLLSGLMGGDSGGNGDMWVGRAISYLQSLLYPLCELRDEKLITLYIGTIREFMPFPKYFELMQHAGITERSRQMMSAFLLDVPGYRADKGLNQSNTFFEQYGYQQMQFTRIVSSLADAYGHIYNTPYGEVSLIDILLNRRILLVLLPALEKSRPELGNLGKIIVAGLKSMMGSQLGAEVEGSKLEIIDARASYSPVPFPATFDEFGYFMPEDSALMWAQARSIGFFLMAAGQDLQAFYRTSKEETLAIVGSSNIKVFGKVEDPTDTWDLISKLAGEAYVTTISGYERKLDSMLDTYRTENQARTERISRVDLLDFKEQIEGEVHIMIKSEIIRARVFYAAPTLCAETRLNHFIGIDTPSDDMIESWRVNVGALLTEVLQEDWQQQLAIQDAYFDALQTRQSNSVYRKYREDKLGAEAGIWLSMHIDPMATVLPHDDFSSSEFQFGQGDTVGPLIYAHDQPEGTTTFDDETNDTVFDGEAPALAQLDLYHEVPRNDKALLVDVDAVLAMAANPLLAALTGQSIDTETGTLPGRLDQTETQAQLVQIMLGLGANPEEAARAADRVIQISVNGTTYPVPPKPVVDDSKVKDMCDVLDDLTRLVKGNGQ